jgi:hypothetical protein
MIVNEKGTDVQKWRDNEEVATGIVISFSDVFFG